MPEIESTSDLRRWGRLRHSLSAKLIFLTILTLVVIFGLVGYLNIRLHRRHLEASALGAAERISDVIKRSTTYYMMRNDRDGLYQVMRTIADEPGMVRVRIFDQEGRISYSTQPAEVSHIVDKNEEACYGCHAQSQPLSKLNRPDRFRIYRNGGGKRVLGIITPIENQPGCANADCHAHPATQQILGVLDTNISLAVADTQLAESTWRMLAYTVVAMLAVAFLSWLFVWKFVAKPLETLERGTQHLADGELGYQIHTTSNDELGDLANSFNSMSLQLRAANEEIVAWARTLEHRVEQKSKELKRAHDQMLHTEKMASVGKMAAVVAHEINNPLSGILTYAKLLRKWMENGSEAKHRGESQQCLELIASESRRCGDLVKNLLTFSRTAPMNPEPSNLNQVVDRLVRLVQHKLEMTSIQLQLELDEKLPLVTCDPAQIEQVLLALVMNAVDAMPRGGNLWLRTHWDSDSGQLEIRVRDDGAGIAPEILPHLFEPFFTTKESGHGVGLGLAISHGIIERHNGRIEVQSEVGKGTTFTITLPVEGGDAALAVAGMTGAGAAAR